jgi:hypothetical protein
MKSTTNTRRRKRTKEGNESKKEETKKNGQGYFLLEISTNCESCILISI